MIGKYTEGKTEQEIKQDMIADLRNTYSNVILNDDGTITIDEVIYEVDYSNGNANKKHNTLSIGNLDIVDSSGNAITGKLSVGTTAYIRFTVNNGTDIVVKDSDETVISLKDGYYKKAITENGTYSFTVTGKVDGEIVLSTPSTIANFFENDQTGLSIGSIVKYEPTGIYNWNAEYATSYATDSADYSGTNIKLQTIVTNGVLGNDNEKTNQDMSIRSWRVLSIDENMGEVLLVPKTINSNTVTLQGPQGYNNAVKMLNDACHDLYSTKNSNNEDIIIARSINIEDFEGKNGTTNGRTLLDTAITIERTNYTNTNDSTESVKYNQMHTIGYKLSKTQFRNSNGEYIICKNYPVIYEREENNNINALVTVAEGKEYGLGLSNQTQLIARNEGTTENPIQGGKVATVGIKPKQTYYNLGTDYATFLGKFKNYETDKKYSILLLPEAENTNYWVASRCISLDDMCCCYDINSVHNGFLSAWMLCNSAEGVESCSRSLFPVVSLSLELLTKVQNEENTYQVNIP